MLMRGVHSRIDLHRCQLLPKTTETNPIKWQKILYFKLIQHSEHDPIYADKVTFSGPECLAQISLGA